MKQKNHQKNTWTWIIMEIKEKTPRNRKMKRGKFVNQIKLSWSRICQNEFTRIINRVYVKIPTVIQFYRYVTTNHSVIIRIFVSTRQPLRNAEEEEEATLIESTGPTLKTIDEERYDSSICCLCPWLAWSLNDLPFIRLRKNKERRQLSSSVTPVPSITLKSVFLAFILSFMIRHQLFLSLTHEKCDGTDCLILSYSFPFSKLQNWITFTEPREENKVHVCNLIVNPWFFFLVKM